MLAPILDVVHLEAVLLEIARRMPMMVEFAAGEDVADHRLVFRALARSALLVALAAPGDRVMQIDPPGSQQPVHRREIGGVVDEADMLEHADRGDLVEAPVELV